MDILTAVQLANGALILGTNLISAVQEAMKNGKDGISDEELEQIAAGTSNAIDNLRQAIFEAKKKRSGNANG